MSDLDSLRKKAAQIPADLSADWEYTNHYEVHDCSIGGDYFWLLIPDMFSSGVWDWQSEEPGQRLGLLLDLGCAAPTLFKRIDQLEAEKVALREIATHPAILDLVIGAGAYHANNNNPKMAEMYNALRIKILSLPADAVIREEGHAYE